ncbi:chitin synthase chs-2-like isoform X2 [Clavelina lepadiformis]|uniref:chitin synthase chs-2-like isoform X2 n=1 Tax=Clavelina lepadiformis TaxID=159417 RepID=UPI004042993F
MVLLTLYLWRHTEKTRLKRMEILFVKAIYSGVLIDQILLLNRRKDEKEFMQRERLQNRTADSRRIRCQRNDLAQSNHRSASFVPQIFLCATMWHETEQEMTQMLTSIMRLDKDQVTLRANRQTREEDYYNFEVHIMFDDAMTYTDGCTPEINNWVRMFCKLIPVAAKKAIEELDDNFDSFPIIYATPYGGKIVFTLPCFQNKLVVHLKDKEKIRHRKRWSQCMYMYYILGYRCTTENWNLDEIFLLALDGDVDFQPEAVSLLVDRMKKNNDVGAACGRIHPIGSGPVVWFQKFEYAVGHWLQKTAEHVLGCVFCSPGCFSLFRGQALVDENVMSTYTTPPSKDIHYIQWDQGEDRWLCTLLLKQGWKIEYCAASDSYTFAPEDFKEFYNQRRRWSPSTMANVIDVLRDASLVVKKNQYVSWGYIIYQIALMVASLLGPATVIMVVQGAYQYVFNWSLTLSLLVSLVPVVFFVIICFTVSADVQVVIAEILTIIYALVMMAVIVGVIGSMASGIILDPNNLFMLLLLAIYGLTGLLHPQEMMCLVHGILYYLCVPSAFIFLMIYSLTNMDNVSWGTREVKSYSQPEAKPENNPDSNKNSKATHTKSSNTTEDSHKCKIGNICECYCCIKPKDDDSQPAPTTQQNLTTPVESQPTSAALGAGGSNNQLQSISNMSNAELFKTARELEIDSDHLSPSQLRKILEDKHQNEDVKNQADAEVANEIESVQLIKETCVDENGNKFSWLRVGALEFAEEKSIDNNERLFWQKLIKKYLEPLKENKNKKQEIAGNLKDLRNRMSAAYIMINALWLVLNFALQLSITDVAIVFYIGSTKNTVNPIQFAFLVFFFIILLIQFTCMLLHRWSTGVHLLSKTKLYTGNEKEITIPTTARHTHEGIPTTASPTTTHARYYNPTFENDLDIACCTEDIAGPSNQQHQGFSL